MKRKNVWVGLFLVLILFCAAVSAAAETSTVTLVGNYGQTEARSILAMMNAFRTGNEAWYWNSDNETQTVLNNLTELEYDDALEQTAMQRAVEIALYFSHTRPNNTKCYTAFTGSYSSMGENIAIGYGSAAAVFEGWQETDKPYSGQGHRRNMLNSKYTHVGIGHAVVNGVDCWVQDFAKNGTGSSSAPLNGTKEMQIEIDHSLVKSVEIPGDIDSMQLSYGDSAALPDTVLLMLNGTWSYIGPSQVKPEMIWSSGDPTIASVSGNTVQANKLGSTSLSAAALGKELSLPLNVTAVDLSDAVITLGQNSYTYDGTAHMPSIATVRVKDRDLTAEDYSFAYSNNINAGTASVTITGKGNYSGTASASFTITAANLTGAAFSTLADKPYTGSPITQSFAVTFNGTALTENTDYTVSYANNTNAGAATVTITGKGNYTGTASASFTITAADIGTGTIAPIPEQIATGSALEPAVTVKVNSRTLIAGTDYTVKYENNVNPGTASVEVTGKGNYTGTLKGSFEITEETAPSIPSEFADDTGSYSIGSDGTASFSKPAGFAANVTVPDTITVNGQPINVTAIADNAFKGNNKLTTITIGKNVKTIGRNAFANCTKLKTVKGGAGVTTIRDSAFSSCKALKTFPAMNKLQKIGANAFKGAKALAKITIAKTVNSIGKNAFNGCAGLKTITVKAEKLTTKNVGAGAFKGINKKATFKCPKKQLKAYKKLFVKKGAPKTCKFK